MRGRNLSSLAVIIIFIAVSAYLSFSGNQTLAETFSGPCKVAGEKWSYDANQNLPPFDCCAGLEACPDGYCCEAGNEKRAITGQITSKASDQSTETTNPTINLDPEPLETVYTCYQNSDCGTDGWVGDPYCKNNDVYQKYRIYICNNAGTINAECFHSDQEKKKEECGENIYKIWNNPYCKNGDVWQSRDFTENGCLNGYCFTNTGTSERIVEACFECSGGECVDDNSGNTVNENTVTCYQNSDCGSNGWVGNTYCKNGDVWQRLRTYTCHSPGTEFSYCSHSDKDMKKQDCSEECSFGSCSSTMIILGYACYNDSDCGTNGWLGQEYCCDGGGENDDVCDTYRNYTCHNPGTPSAYCTHTDEDMVKQDCGDTGCGNWSDPYCYDGDVWHYRVCTWRGCDEYGCYDTGGIDDEKLEECGSYTCTNGKCDFDCYEDSDCGTDGWLGQEYCTSGGGENEDLADTYRNYTCSNPGTPSAYCTHTDEDKIKQDCGDSECGAWSNTYCKDGDVYHSRSCTWRGCGSEGCYDGSGVEEEKFVECGSYTCTDGNCDFECYEDSDCGTNGWVGDPYCKDGDVYQNYRNHICNNAGTIDSYCSYSDTENKKEECGSKDCADGECVEPNNPPSIDSYSPTTDPTINVGESQTFSIAKSDPDGDTLTVKWFVDGAQKKQGSDTYTYTATTAGTYNVTVKVSDGEASVSHEWTLTVNQEGENPDLKVSNLRVMWPPDPKAGEITSFEFKIKNIGNKKAENVGFRFDTGESNWNPQQGITLDPGEEIYVAYDHTYDNPGTYTVTAIADPNNQISESNENNNQMSIAVVVS